MQRGSFVEDRRGAITFNIVVFFATLAMGFALYIALEPAGSALLDVAATNTETDAAADGQEYVGYAWQSLHLIVIGLGTLQLLVAAVFDANIGGIGP